MQSVAVLLPTGEMKSGGQILHIPAPGFGLYVSAGHNVHAPPSGPVDPLLHVQKLLPAGELEFVEQLLHSTFEPTKKVITEFLYFPASHSEHGPSIGPSDPSLQVQEVLNEFGDEFIGHASHAPLPWLFLKVPLAHCIHAAPSGPVDPLLQVQIELPVDEPEFCRHVLHVPTPGLALYLPETHSEHSSVPGFVLKVPASHDVQFPSKFDLQITLQARYVVLSRLLWDACDSRYVW